MTQPRRPLADRLRAVPDHKARGRLRVAEVVAAHRSAGLTWVGANGWTFVLDAPPDVHLSAKDSQRAAARFDLTVRDGARVVFRDRILAWDGTPVMVPDGTKRVEIVDGLPTELDNFREDAVQGARVDIEHTVRVVTKGGTQPHVKAKPGTVSTFYSGTTDGYIVSGDATYTTARSGSVDGTNTNNTIIVSGQFLNGGAYSCYESGLQWDTSALGSDTVSAAALSLWGDTDGSNSDFTTNVRLYDWGASLANDDWIAGASLSGNTLLATFASASMATGAYNTFTDVAFAANVNTAGATRVILSSSELEAGNAPAGFQYAYWSSADVASTTQDPKLVVTHAANVSVTPSTASVTLATFAPTVTVSDHKTVTPGAAAVTLATFAPSAILGTVITPATASINLATFAPTATLSDNKIVTPDAASLTLTGYAPALTIALILTPGTASIVLTGYAPTIKQVVFGGDDYGSHAFGNSLYTKPNYYQPARWKPLRYKPPTWFRR